MTSRKAQWLAQYIAGLRYIVTFASMVAFLSAGVTFAQSDYNTSYGGSLHWKTPTITGQQSSQSQVIARPAIPSQVLQVQYAEPVQPPSLIPSGDSEVRIAQVPSADALRDTINPERRPLMTPNPPMPNIGGSVAPAPSTFTDMPRGVVAPSGSTARQVLGECRDPRDPKLFRPMSELSIQIDFPIDLTDLNMCPINVGAYQERNWTPICFQYNASALCHKAAYFEDISVERYGHSWGPFLQPVISAGKFYLSVAFLPYHIGLTPPQECVYAIGYYRPGSCAPHMIDPLPISVRAGLMQAGAVTGIAYAIP